MNMVWKILIIDDEVKSREVLKALISMSGSDESQYDIQTCGDILSGLEAIRSFRPDMLFLDISLKEGDSFELLNGVDEWSFEMAFITAYDEYAVKALHYAGIPCLLKPIELEGLSQTLSMLKQKMGSGYAKKRYPAAYTLIASKGGIIPILVNGKWVELEAVNIKEIKVVGHKTRVVTKGGIYDTEVSKTDITYFIGERGKHL
jgi:DNA-binding LytR/AlgR family response regulator